MDKRDILQLAMMEFLEPEDTLMLLQATESGKDKGSFNLDGISDQDCKEFFRFSRDMLEVLVVELRIPKITRTENGSSCSGMEGLCLLLRRLAYPNRYTDVKHIFQRSKSELLLLFNAILDHVYDNFDFLLTSLNLCWLRAEDLDEFITAVSNNGSPLNNCWSFIDGSARPISRPVEGQRVVWNGHYRIHSLAFQAVVVPNGLMVNLAGPWPGGRHDAGILRESGLVEKLQQKMTWISRNYVVYGDPAYPVSDVIEAPFRMHAGGLTDDEATFNQDMAKRRMCVEWNFEKLVNNFGFIDFSKNLKILLQPIGKYYTVAALLNNLHSISYGSQTESFFGVKPPSVKQYLRNTRNV